MVQVHDMSFPIDYLRGGDGAYNTCHALRTQHMSESLDLLSD